MQGTHFIEHPLNSHFLQCTKNGDTTIANIVAAINTRKKSRSRVIFILYIKRNDQYIYNLKLVIIQSDIMMLSSDNVYLKEKDYVSIAQQEQ